MRDRIRNIILVIGLYRAKNKVVLPKVLDESYAIWKYDRDFK